MSILHAAETLMIVIVYIGNTDGYHLFNKNITTLERVWRWPPHINRTRNPLHDYWSLCNQSR